MWLILQECIQQRTVEEIVEVPVAQIQEQIVHVGEVVPRGRPCERIVEQLIGIPVPQMVEELDVVKAVP